MSIFVKFPKFRCLLQKYLLTELELDDVITQFQLKIPIVIRYVLNFPRLAHISANFIIEMIGN